MVLLQLSTLSVFLLLTGLCKGEPHGTKTFRPASLSFQIKPSGKDPKRASNGNYHDVYWSGQPFSNHHSRPGLPYPLPPNRVKVPLYPGSSAWTWGDRFQVNLPNSNAVKFRPVGSSQQRPSGVYVKQPETNVPPPITLPQNEYNSIVQSLSSSSAHATSQPYAVSTFGSDYWTSTKPTARPTSKKPSQFLYIKDNMQQISVENTGSNKDSDNIASSLTVLDPDDSSELTLLHGSILVSSNQKRPVPQPLYRPSHSGSYVSSGHASQEKINSSNNVFVSTDSSSALPLPKNVSLGVNFLENVAESDPLTQFINLNSASLIEEEVTTGPSESLPETLPDLQGNDFNLLDEFFTSSDILDSGHQQTTPEPVTTPSTTTSVTATPNELATNPSSEPIFDTLLIPPEEVATTTEEPLEPETLPLFASVPAASPSLISSQIIQNVPVAQPLSIGVANVAATGGSQPMSFQSLPIPTPSASNVLSATGSSDLSTGTLLQFAAQISLPVIIFFGIMFLLVTVNAGRRRRRDLADSARTLMKIPDGFPLELLGR